MSQLVACRAANGIVIAADRRVEIRDPAGDMAQSHRKLYPVGKRAVIATSGAAVGISISRELSSRFAHAPHLDFGELEELTRSFFQHRYNEFVAQGAQWFAAHPQALQLAYFLLAGIDADNGFAMRFYASEGHGQPFRSLPMGEAITAPRRMGLETRLVSALRKEATLEEISQVVSAGCAQIEKLEEAVAGPFDIALLRHNGISLGTV